MTGEILTRTLVALAIAGVGFGIYELTNRVLLSRVSNQAMRGLEGFKPGIPAILYFTSPTCVPCKTTQRPALRSVQQSLGDRIQIIEVDASDQPELADHWGVLSVPTTFIINKTGEPRHINHGVTLADKLLRQVENFA